MAEPKFGAVTAATAVAEKNAAIYAQQKEALEKSPVASTLLRALWPAAPTAASVHAYTPLEKDGVRTFATDMPTLIVRKDNLLNLVQFIRGDATFGYDFLLDLTAVDFLNSPRADDKADNDGKRFQVQYLFRPRATDRRSATLRIGVPVDENEEVPSLTQIWPGANWPEREVFDLMGIRFAGHPNLRRIVLPENYRGHPLRKDFPVKGIGEDYLIEDLLYKRRNED
ncbi:MAG: NADH-quinone oxidoreductase subunit C [Spirochaetes bacterium]|nr:NADH-quinone oxidoreductase subunit C [Spirochaetota bacterium]